MPQDAGTTPADSQRVAGATVRSVRSDHVGGAHRHRVPPPWIDVGGHAVIVLGEVDEFGRETYVGVGRPPVPAAPAPCAPVSRSAHG